MNKFTLFLLKSCQQRLAGLVLLTTVVAYNDFAFGATLLHDEFITFFLESGWQAHGEGAPDLALGVLQPSAFLNALELRSDGVGKEFRGIENSVPISLTGLSSVTVDIRLKPVNMGMNGSLAAAGIALLGSSGEFVSAFASNNPTNEANDWANHYEDSMNNVATSGAFAHCAYGGCDSFRRFLITVGPQGSQLEVRNSDDSPHAFGTNFSSLKLADLGSELTVALRQQSVNGGDPVSGWFDRITVTGLEGSFSPPAANGILLHAPYSQLATGTWQVRPLAGQQGFTFASYNNPTGLPNLQQYTAMMQSRGLGNGIDLGSAPRPWVVSEYEHIKSLGWSFSAWPGASDHQVDGGSGLATADEAVISILDGPGVTTPIHLGEWGYYFHELSSNAGYFAAIYPGQDPSSYAHLMKAPGSKGYDTPPTNRVDAYNQMKAYYTNRDADWGSRISSVTGHSQYEAYSAEWGSPTIGLEIGENIRFTQSKFAFARGAARQWDKPWSSQVSPWFHGSLTTAGPLTGGAGTARGQDAGHSFSFYKRAWLHSWFAGAARVTPEFSMGNLFETTSAPWDLTPLGDLAVEVTDVINTHDRGVPYTPVAILIDQYAGYNAFQDKPWGVFSKTSGDQQTYDLFQHQLFPGSADSNSPGAANPEAPYLVSTPHGEMFDVLTTLAAANSLLAYPEVLLAGDITFTPGFIASLEGALSSGSRLLLKQEHVSSMGAANFDLLQTAGDVMIVDEWLNPSTGRSAAISNDMLNQLHDQHMPISLSGDSIQYQVNRNEEGWVVELVNNDGVVKIPHLPAVTDVNAVANVELQPTVEVYGAYDWLTGEWLAADISPWNIAVGAGDVRFVQLVSAFDADFDLDGDVDGADFLRWQVGAGSFNGEADRGSGDANGDGFVDAADLARWQEQLGMSFELPLPAILTVPEPSTWLMFVITCSVFLSSRTARLPTVCQTPLEVLTIFPIPNHSKAFASC